MDKTLLPPRDLAKLRKVAALFNSSNEGERGAARSRGTALVTPYGWTFSDVPSLLDGTAKVTSSPTGGAFNLFSGFEDFMEQQEPGYKAREALARATQKLADTIARAELIKRYGSADAVLCPDAHEAAVNAAAAPFVQVVDERHGYRHETLSGWTGNEQIEALPEPVAAALKAKPRFPSTITEAKVEHDYWNRRIGELNLIQPDLGSYPLSEACQARYQLIYKALMTDLRAQSIAEAIVRRTEIAEADHDFADAEQCLLADLEFLASRERRVIKKPTTTNRAKHSAQSGRTQTATDRRSDIVRFLSNMDTRTMSDREIARRVGVSPQTVGNIRRRVVEQLSLQL